MCKGDYGSPLFWLDSKNNYRAILVGISIFPYLDHKCEDHKFSIFSYIPNRIQWIKKVLGEESEMCALPPACSCAAIPPPMYL